MSSDPFTAGEWVWYIAELLHFDKLTGIYLALSWPVAINMFKDTEFHPREIDK